ncbi:MAG TPA: type I-C CRISPR-associated protein Cas8c/Csd1 [Clostridiales bacterium]|nr:type I-C CRISPR-associated protein Cas8c/Csd1 [Clostridiales bacterium]
MGMFQNLLETYEKCSDAIGITPIDADGNVNEKKTLLPVFHMTFKSEICVTIDKSGKFIRATRDSKEMTIIIPCTEKSLGRASGIAAHPLCDQLDYVGGINKDKLDDYLSELGAWKGDIEELNAIYTYISGQTIIQDLLNSGIFKGKEFSPQKDKLDDEKIRKIGVRFSVVMDGDTINVWESKSLRDAWINHVKNTMVCEDRLFDYISGREVAQIAKQHPKNINSLTANAKLLSCNDFSGFTFRGRFVEQDDAVIVDYIQSQKMHQMLRWLIANYGYAIDSQVVVAWGVDRDTEVKVKAQDATIDLFKSLKKIKTDTEILAEISALVYSEFAKNLKKLLQGYGSAHAIKQHSRKICIAVFDAATEGRMGLVFYQELLEDDYLEQIYKWHLDTSYFMTGWKREKDDNGRERNIPISYIGAPSYDDIIFAVYGKSHGDKSYDILKKKTRKQLLECMFGGFAFPKNILEMAANRASHPMGFTDSNGKFNENEWRRAINITCALARKFFKQHKGEDIELELNENRRNRDYLYGRLLSVADRLERTALYKSDKQDTRTTNAIRLMSAFQVKPYATWLQIYTQLIPYINQLNGAKYYQNLIDSIMVLFKDGEYEDNSPLSPLYLLGFSAQNRAFLKTNKNENLEGEVNENVTE